MNVTNHDVLNKFAELYGDLFVHDGYGEIRVEMRILKRGQKEVILHCGKQYRFIVDYSNDRPGVDRSLPVGAVSS